MSRRRYTKEQIKEFQRLFDEKVKALKIELENAPVKDKLDLEICIHTYHYQRRLTWMLSSILQQKGNIPNIVINISHTDNDGTPTTEEVCNFFRKQGLNIKETLMTEKEVCNRAIARNKQMTETSSDFILFADSDMVYDTRFFENLHKQMKTNLKSETRVMGADRHSLNIEFCIKYFENDMTKYPCVVNDVANIAAKWPLKWIHGGGTAAGNFQLANVKAVTVLSKKKYTHRTHDFWRATGSDRLFRCRMGGRTAITTLPQYHLNHDRKGPELQR